MHQTKLTDVLLLLLVLIWLPASANAQQTAISNSQAEANLFAHADGVPSTSSRGVRGVAGAETPRPLRPFRTFALGFKASTLGAGIEVATPLSRRFNLRAGANLFAFAYPFNIDGIDYNADLHFRSGQLSLDWFPERRGGFHVSAGMIFLRNNLSALASAPPGGYFELGSQGFINSVDDPLNGSAGVVYPRSIAPMLMLGFSNILPRNGKHLSMPYEIGIAYTGPPRVNIHIDGTACTYEGCFDAATNAEMQQSIQQEELKLDKSLQSLPVYPIVSLGLAYRF